MNKGSRIQFFQYCLLGCLIILVGVMIVLGVYLVRLFNSERFHALDQQRRLIRQCRLERLMPLYRAIQRYELRNGRAPDRLENLVPRYLENVDLLHCPADPDPKRRISYRYVPPGANSPAETIILSCPYHRVGENPVLLQITRKGDYKVEVVNTGGTER